MPGHGRPTAREPSPPVAAIGLVSLVGAGPGDPGLITVRGQEAIARAEVVIYDRLANPRLLGHAPAHAERIYVGKQPGDRTWRQSQINELLIERARAGQSVCRLKGGDPFVFGRGGEEAVALAAAGVPFEVVPGVSSAIAVPAYAGIPVTYRGLCSALGVIAGHSDPEGVGGLRFAELAQGLDTLVFVMSIESLPEIVAGLRAGGRTAGTPVALIRCGTWSSQETLVGTLGTIVELAHAAHFRPPAVTVVGEVVRLRDQLRWFDNRPLFGRRVLVTRAKDQAADLSRRLEALGAEPLELPLIRLEPILHAPSQALDATYDWVIFASANAVQQFWGYLDRNMKDWRALGGARIAVVGPATENALRQHHLRPDFVPDSYEARAMLAAFPEELAGQRVLLPRVEGGPDALPEGLRAAGANVEVLSVYRNLPDGEDASEIERALAGGELDAVTFTSTSTVRGFFRLLPHADLSGCLVACIGPSTAATARELGVSRVEVAEEHTVEGLVEVLLQQLRR
jgi:uroporphyrinogen III methyltransferase / synthase